ncbi:MAG: Crp/Fnr family transcriptional regulator [Bacteroidota bacterium]|nr:Crp/Fnr family transcriptional regulator [Bacteroidota bacterium]
MLHSIDIQKRLAPLGKELSSKVIEISSAHEIKKGVEILKEGQYVRSIPIVINGLLKVFTRHEEKELLLYYIQPSESCIMSFSASLSNDKSKVYATTIEDSVLLLIPSDKINELTHQYPEFNDLFHQQFKVRYNDLLDTINQLVFTNLDQRLFHFLKESSRVRKENPLFISHREIANELGTAREVVSRVMKKLEKEQKVIQNQDSIKIL